MVKISVKISYIFPALKLAEKACNIPKVNFIYSATYRIYKLSVIFPRTFKQCKLLQFLSDGSIIGTSVTFLCSCIQELDLEITHLKTKRRPLYLKLQSVPRSKHFSSRL